MPAILPHHEIAGSGPHVLLLHPVGLDLTFLAPLSDALCDRYTVLRADMRGHGDTPTGSRPAAFADLVEDIHRLLRETGFAPAAVVGMSFGGMLAQVLAVTHPEDVSALVLCATASTFSPDLREVMEKRAAAAEHGGMAAVLEDTLQRWFTEDFLARSGGDAARERLLADDIAGWAQTWRAIATLDVAPRLHEITVPTLCVAGEQDTATPPAVVAAICNRIPGASYTVLKGAPHMLFLEQPAETAAEIGAFLERTIGRGG
jgi:3-oxoadipate enol-lactonase